METNLDCKLADVLDVNHISLKHCVKQMGLTTLFLTCLITLSCLITVLILFTAIPAGFLIGYYLTITAFKNFKEKL